MTCTRSDLIAVALTIGLSVATAACSGGNGPVPRGGAGAEAGDEALEGLGSAFGPPGPPDTGLRLVEQWTWAAPGRSSAGMPAADADGVAFTSGHRLTVLVDGAGRVRWQVERVGVRDVAPRLTADLVLVPTDDGVIAYDRGSGALRWEATLDERANTPTVLAGKAVVTTWEGSLLALDLAVGRVLWQSRLGGPALGPATSAGDVAVATWDEGRSAGVTAVDAGSGRTRWSGPLPPGGVSAPAVATSGTGSDTSAGAAAGMAGGPNAGGVVVVVAGDRAAHGLALDTGSRRWRLALGGAGSPEVPPLALADGTVLVPHRLGGVVLVDSADGRSHWEAATDGAAVRGGPAGPGPNGWFAMPLDDGRLLLAGPDGPPDLREPPALVTGVASGLDGLLVVGTGQGVENGVSGLSGW